MGPAEHFIPVTRTARYFTLGTPGPQTRHLWYALHGYGQLASYFIRHFEAIATPDTLVVAPEGLSLFYLPPGWDRVGATWMTKEKRLSEIQDYIAYLDQLHRTISQNLPADCTVTILGFSQGATTAWRWARAGNIRPHHFINWAGTLPDEPWPSMPNLYYVSATDDEYMTPDAADRQAQKLQQISPGMRTYRFQGNHRMDRDTLVTLAQDISALP